MPAAAWLASYELGGEIMMRTIPLLAGTLALVTGVLTAEVNAASARPPRRPGPS
jgi:hypothetical protein